MSGLFGDLDWDNVPENPFEINPGEHLCHITDVKVGPTKDESKMGVTLIYTIDEGQDGAGLQINDWKEIIVPADPANPTAEELRRASFIRLRLESLGIPASQIGSLQREQLLGKAVKVTTTAGQNGFPNIKNVELNAEGIVTPSMVGGVSGDPFA